MTSWIDRPTEIAYLFNPAFIGLSILGMTDGYSKTSKRGIQFPLVFVGMPIVLNERSRIALPTSIASSMLLWIQKNPEAMASLPQRIRSFKIFVQEGLIFMCQQGYLMIDNNGLICMGNKKRPGETKCETAVGPNEFEVYKASVFVGRWFAKTGDFSTISTLWGIKRELSN